MLTRLSKVSVLMFLLGVSACKSPPPVQSQRPEPAAWAMGESPGLTADAELNYYRLRSGIDKITAQVNYLQEYIRTQCLK
ncbi:Putative endopeptidase [Escherichia coli]|nr:Putative endopeptidase [Escherichia coli]